MEITAAKMLLNNMSYFFHFSSGDYSSQLVQKYHQKIEEMLKLLRPTLDAILDTEIVVDELLQKALAGLNQSVDELRELYENCHPLMSVVYFVLQVESLMAKVQTHGLEVLDLLISFEGLPIELNSTSLEQHMQKFKRIGYEETSNVITKAIKDQVEGSEPSSDCLENISSCLSLKSNQEVLIEIVALKKLKENADQGERNEEVDYMDKMIGLVTHMHDCLVRTEQSKSFNSVPISADFCCPLSLELMTDPVIVASGQTYERVYIQKWIDLGLNICPETMRTLAYTKLVPNYTIKATIASWCESNNVKLPDPIKSSNLNQSRFLHSSAELSDSGDSQTLPHSRINPPTSPDSRRSISSPRNNSILSNGSHQEGASSGHHHSSSKDSLTRLVENGQANIEKLSLRNVESRLDDLEEKDLNSRGNMLSTRQEFSRGAAVDKEPSQCHNRTDSASSVHSKSLNLSGDGNGMSADATCSCSSGEASSVPQLTPAQAPPLKAPEYAPRNETRSHNPLWRRPSRRFALRIVSSSTSLISTDLSAVESQVQRWVDDLTSTSLDAQREATYELRVLTKLNMESRIVIANLGAISLLVNHLRTTDQQIQENAVTTLLNLSINDNNKIAIANAGAIEPLIHVLETGSSRAKENSAATLFSLSLIEENKLRIGNSGAVGPLVDLLEHGTPLGKKDAATALINLSKCPENKGRIVQAGAVRHLMELLDPATGMVDKAVVVLSNLATIPEGRQAIGQAGGIPVLVQVIELGSSRAKENAAAALLKLCTDNNRYCNMIIQEGAVPPLVALSQSGTSRAKEKAQTLLNYFRSQRHGNTVRG